MLIADKNNVRLSDFVKAKLGNKNEKFKFESFNAFYEFSEEEDLLYFREVVVMNATTFNRTFSGKEVRFKNLVDIYI